MKNNHFEKYDTHQHEIMILITFKHNLKFKVNNFFNSFLSHFVIWKYFSIFFRRKPTFFF